MMVDNYIGTKLKRKDFDHHDLLSSPALKIRRLDVELPPIIGEEEAEIQFGDDQWMSGFGSQTSDRLKPLDIEELSFVPETKEKAIVVFQPVDPLPYSSGKFFVDPDLISSFKNQVLSGSHLNSFTPNQEDEEAVRNGDNTEGTNTCKAVIPWFPSQQLNQEFLPHVASHAEVSEAMDAEGPETSAMEIEDSGASSFCQQETESINYSRLSEASHQQWQQQHCMIPQPPQNIATPIVWYR